MEIEQECGKVQYYRHFSRIFMFPRC